MNCDNVKKIGKLLLKNIAQMLGIVLLFGGVGGIIFFATEFLIGIFGTWPALTIMGGCIVAVSATFCTVADYVADKKIAELKDRSK